MSETQGSGAGLTVGSPNCGTWGLQRLQYLRAEDRGKWEAFGIKSPLYLI